MSNTTRNRYRIALMSLLALSFARCLFDGEEPVRPTPDECVGVWNLIPETLKVLSNVTIADGVYPTIELRSDTSFEAVKFPFGHRSDSYKLVNATGSWHVVELEHYSVLDLWFDESHGGTQLMSFSQKDGQMRFSIYVNGFAAEDGLRLLYQKTL